MTRKSYTFGKWTFRSQKDLESAVKSERAALPRNQPVINELLLDVLNHLHPDVQSSGLTAIRIQILSGTEQRRRGMETAEKFAGNDLTMAYFKPIGEWRKVTLYPWRKGSSRAIVKRAFREIIAGYLPDPEKHHRCCIPRCTAAWDSLQYHHVSPTFDEIAEKCIALCTEEEICTKFGYNKFEFSDDIDSFADIIPATHPAVRELIKLHMNNQWAWMCAEHHHMTLSRIEQVLSSAA